MFTFVGLRAAEPLELLLLQDAQQLHLDIQRQLADFVEEDRAVVRQLEASVLLLHRAGERTALVSEQLAFGQARRKRAAVHLHHHAVAAATEAVKGSRDQLLAGAGLAEEQHRGIGVRDALDRAEHLPHRRRLSDDLAEAPLDL